MDFAITVYGVDACEDTTRTREHLGDLAIGYRYVDLEDDPEADRMVKRLHDGRRITPTVVIVSGTEVKTLSEPENSELDIELNRLHLLPRGREGDHKPTRHRLRSRGSRKIA